jgi:hypothetical protein
MKDIQEILDSIKAQREKQIEKGYTVDHDLQYKNGQLPLAALTLVGFAHGQTSGDNNFKEAKELWPFKNFSPSESVQDNLVQACSLIIAEIQRLSQ